MAQNEGNWHREEPASKSSCQNETITLICVSEEVEGSYDQSLPEDVDQK